MSVAPKLDCRPFPTPRRHIVLGAGEKGVIWEEHMTGFYTGFIDRVSVSRGDNRLGCDGTYVDFIVDGELIERIKREISTNLPDRFAPEQVVRRKALFRAHNGDSQAHTFEVVVQGKMCRPIPVKTF